MKLQEDQGWKGKKSRRCKRQDRFCNGVFDQQWTTHEQYRKPEDLQWDNVVDVLKEKKELSRILKHRSQVRTKKSFVRFAESGHLPFTDPHCKDYQRAYFSKMNSEPKRMEWSVKKESPNEGGKYNGR